MVFSSSIFLFIFLPVVLLGYYVIRKPLRNAFLLIMSLGFYAWGEPKFVFVMIASILLNYAAGLLIDWTKRTRGLGWQRLALWLTVAFNLGMLFYYKYADFTLSVLNRTLGLSLPSLGIVLPIGISFFTFQGMSYVLDLYMGKVSVQKKLLNVALYISLFPQLIAGPIVRYSDVNDQIDDREINVEKFASGVRRFTIGLTKKVLLANITAQTVDEIFALLPVSMDVSTAWLGVICYALQIYFDFSGYSDMAIGLGSMFGFTFLENFNYPYISRSITEFWRRWHISLSTWFRDYLYIPLGGSRKGNVYVNLCIVFLATGIWHGAAFTFILWGIWHGVFRLLERVMQQKGRKFLTDIPVVNYIYTLLVVLLGWVLFRADSVSYALQYAGRMFGLVRAGTICYTFGWFLTPKLLIVLICALIACVPLKQVFVRTSAWLEQSDIGLTLRNVYTVAMLVLSVALVMTSTYNPFIYFRF